MIETQNAVTNPVDHLPAREYGIVLSRDLGWLDASLIGVGATLGAGVFVLLGVAAGLTGPALPLAWALAGLVAVLTAAAYAELSSAFPEAGGSYLWARESLGGLPGFLAGWLGWLAHAAACSLYALGLGAYLAVLVVEPGWLGVAPGGLQKLFAVGVALLLAYLNYRGAQSSRRAGSLIALAMIATLALVIPAGLAALGHKPGWPGQFTPLLPNGISGLLAAMGVTFIAFTGYEMIAQASEEVRQPRRNIPRAIFLSLVIGTAVAVIVAFVAVAALDDGSQPGWRQLAATGETAMVTAARQWRPGGAWVVIIAGLLGTAAALNAGMYTSARIAFAMGRDKALPGPFGAVHAKHRTPHRAILFSAALAVGVVVALPIEGIAALTSSAFLLLSMLVNASVIVLRRNRPDLRRGFRAPWVPGLPVVGIVFMGGLAACLFARGPLAWLPALVWVGGGVAVYFLYAQWHSASRAPVVEAGVELTRAFRVVLPVAKPERAEQLSPLAAALAGRKDGEVLATHVAVVPAQLPLRSGRHFAEQIQPVLQRAAQIITAAGVPAHSMVRVAHDAASGIREAAHETGAEVIVIGWQPKPRTRDRLLGPTLDPLLADPPCNVVVLRAETLGAAHRILVPMAGGPNATLAMSYALRLAEHWDSQVTAMTVVASDASEAERQAAERMLDEALGRHAGHARLQAQAVAAKNPLEGILQQAAAHDLVMLGASREGVIDRALFGDIPEQVAASCETPVIIVKRRVGPMTGWLRRALDRASARMPRLTPEERIEVYKAIRRSARPDTDYFVMIGLAAGIASLGLLLNSPAVIIGAMLVAPLMAAIVGLGMGIMMGDLRLLRLAASATLRGMFLAMGVGLLAGWLAPSTAPTAEILSRTQPTLLDLGVALLSGAAGAYALCREDVSASLPGVAIAAALVPPLATAGIGLARGDVNIAGGATLLFVTNLIAISAASVIVFLLFGFRPAPDAERLNVLRRGMIGAAVLLAVVALTLSLLTFNLVKQVRFEQQVRAAVVAGVAQLGQVEVVAVQIDRLAGEGVSLEVTIRSARNVSYEQTVTLQKTIAGRLNRTIALRLTVIPTTQLDPFVPPTPTPTSTATPTPDLTATSTWTPSATPTATATEVPTSTARPSPTARATSTPTPTASPTPTLTATPTPTALITAIVANTDGRGVRVRAAPGGPTVTAWHEGTRVTLVAGPIQSGGREWLRVQDESGLEGWVAAEYVLITP